MEELEYLKEHYPDTPMSDLMAHLNKSQRAIYDGAKKLNVKRSDAFLNSPLSGRLQSGSKLGEKTRFKKGAVPQNKGKKMPEEIKAKYSHTFFKRGHTPHNAKKVGDVAPIKDGYLKIKIAEPNTWKLLHRLVWEESNGPIPKGYRIHFKDGVVTNCELSNLELITDQDAMDRNRVSHLPLELQQVIKLKNKITKQIKNHGKK